MLDQTCLYMHHNGRPCPSMCYYSLLQLITREQFDAALTWTSKTMRRSPFWPGCLDLGMPSPFTTRTYPGVTTCRAISCDQ